VITRYPSGLHIKYASLFVIAAAVFVLFVPQQAVADKAFALTLHPRAQVLKDSNYIEKDYIIALDKYRKKEDRWVPRKWQRQSGQLQRYTIEMPRDYVEEDVFFYYKAQIPDSAERLFGCKGRQCGESNNWANDYFGVKQLYGTDDSQIFSVYRIPTPKVIAETEEMRGPGVTGDVDNLAALDKPMLPHADIYITLYIVRRGNERLYTQLETLYVR
jgi:hypothetical protein